MRPIRLAGLPIRTKLTLAYTGVIAVMLGAIGLFLFSHFKSGLDASLNAALRARAGDVGDLAREEGVRRLVRRPHLVAPGFPVQILDRGGRVLFSSAAPGRRPLVTPAEASDSHPTIRYIDRGENQRVLVRSVGHQVIAVRAPLDQRERALELLSSALLVGGALTLLAVVLAGYGLAGAVLRPMEAMREAAARISDADPHARLPLSPAEDEVHRLGATLNAMLARVEQARKHERRFVADASHELRTPLAVLKTEVEVALRSDNPAEALRAALQVVGDEADRLIQLSEQLLLLASSDVGKLELDVRAANAHDVLENVARRFRLRSREHDREIRVDSNGDVGFAADVPRIEQALGNLVDNSFRHGAGAITLSAVRDNGWVELHVTDEGEGLPPAFLPDAFARFTRATRGRSGSGSGLGLSIVEAIADAHRGQAGLRNRDDRPGTDAWLRLPQQVNT